MAKASSIISNALNIADRKLNVISDNFARAQVPGAQRIDSVLSVDGSTGMSFIDLTERRSTNQALSGQLRSITTSFNQAKEISDALQDLQTVLGDPANPTKSGFVVAVNDFFGKAITIAGNFSISGVQDFIQKGVRLADTLSTAANKVNQLRFNADQNLSSALQDANSTIREIYNLNRSINRNGSAALNLLDERDKLLATLAQQFDIQVRFTDKGAALISAQGSGVDIVNRTQYAQFSYDNLISEDILLNGAKINPITLNYANDSGNISNIDIEVVGGADNPNSYQISGGKIMGLTKLRDDILTNSLAAISNLSKLVADNVNALHNNSSTFPPKTSFTSSEKFSLSDSNMWSGSTTINILNPDGSAVQGSSGFFKPITINLASLANPANNGLVKVQDIITEINSFLNDGPSKPRNSLGEIKDATGNPIADKYLLNDIKLAGKSNIDADGNFTFDLELDGNSYFGSTIEILQIQTGIAGGPLASIPANQLPADFKLAKDAHLRTNQAVTIGGVVAGPNTNVQIKVRIIGDNGAVDEGIVNFSVNPADLSMLNKRIEGTIVPNAPPGGFTGFMQSNPTLPSIAKAKLVNDDGLEIAGTDIYTKGNLVIESINQQYGIVIGNDASAALGNNLQGLAASNYGFSQFFGFNNFFELDNIHNTIAVRADIINDASKLASAAIMQDAGTIDTVKVGSIQAMAQLDFNGIVGQDFGINDTVSINGIIFAFNGGPNPTDVMLGGNLQTSVQNLVAKINDNDSLKSIIAATSIADDITLTAINPGSNGNQISVAANLTNGPITVALNNAAPVNNLPNSAFINGTDADQQITTYGKFVGKTSTGFFEELNDLNKRILSVGGESSILPTTATISGYSSIVSGFLANQTIEAGREKTVQEISFGKLSEQLKKETGIKVEEVVQEAYENYQYKQALMTLQKILNKMLDMVISSY